MKTMSRFSQRFILGSLLASSYLCLFSKVLAQTAQPAGVGRREAQNRKIGEPTSQLPQHITGGFDLPNGWRITPAGNPIVETEDMVLKMVAAPDGRAVIATHSGYNL